MRCLTTKCSYQSPRCSLCRNNHRLWTRACSRLGIDPLFHITAANSCAAVGEAPAVKSSKPRTSTQRIFKNPSPANAQQVSSPDKRQTDAALYPRADPRELGRVLTASDGTRWTRREYRFPKQFENVGAPGSARQRVQPSNSQELLRSLTRPPERLSGPPDPAVWAVLRRYERYGREEGSGTRLPELLEATQMGTDSVWKTV